MYRWEVQRALVHIYGLYICCSISPAPHAQCLVEFRITFASHETYLVFRTDASLRMRKFPFCMATVTNFFLSNSRTSLSYALSREGFSSDPNWLGERQIFVTACRRLHAQIDQLWRIVIHNTASIFNGDNVIQILLLIL